MALVTGFAGGIGLFLLGMWLMTEGLKLAAGPALERILARSTGTRLRGLASGALVTSVVQSSSAVIVATIGFVNAGLLTLGQALWVLFGANVGTTMTGWLVAIAGLDFKIDALALPLIGVGMLLQLTGQHTRRGPIGLALAGFGTLFFGIDVLRATFSGLGSEMGLPSIDNRVLSVLAHVAAGMVLTVLMQSSSAALAVALTAAQSGALPLTAATAVVIGANLGTTVKALLAALGATANAKRAAMAHVAFNLLTAMVALLLLPWLVAGIVAVGKALHLDTAPAATLALFHSVFNVLGVLLMWPLADRLADFLRQRFRSAEEDEARPRHLDDNASAVPALALAALTQEIRRMGAISVRMSENALATPAREVARDALVVQRLHRAMAEFVTRLQRAAMTQDSAVRLPDLLRLARYYVALAELAEAQARAPVGGMPVAPWQDFLALARDLLRRADPARGPEPTLAEDARLDVLGDRYQALKAALLRAGANGELDMDGMEALLRAASLTRRACEQALKAARLMLRLEARQPAPEGMSEEHAMSDY